ncbi:hypothetical protein ACEPPN_012308 [Leptodophora sp. 'Broadleaf-Isolate-01']
MSSRPPFPFDPLDPSTADIRLLTIEPAAIDDPLRCTLRHVALDENLHHEALSYVWGDENKTLPITVNNHTIQVTTNLEAALRHLRSNQKGRHIWIDAVCINQSNAIEKSDQVLRMTDIYRFAKKVVVWLGKDDDEDQEDDPMEDWKGTARASAQETFLFVLESAMFLAGHANITYKAEELFMHEKSRGAHLRLVEMLNRKWFQRLWTLQEIAVASDVEVVCGTASVPWKYLYQTLEAFSKAEKTVPLDRYLYVLPLTALRDIEFCRVEYQLFSLTDSDPAKAIEYEVSPLINVLYYVVGRRKMKDIRDRLYGILGLYFDKEKWAQDPRLRPDYEKSHADVFAGLARYLIEDHKQVGIICTQQERDIEGIPSWVPTWASTADKTHLNSYMDTKPIERRSGVDFDPVFSRDGRTLTVRGRHFSYIEFLGTPAEETPPSESELGEDWISFMRKIVLKWKQEVTSCPLLKRNYRETSWKDIEGDFCEMIIHGMTEKATDMFYECLVNEGLMKEIVEGSARGEPQEDRDYQLKVMLLDQARWCRNLFGRLGKDVPFVTRQGKIGLAANGCRPQLGDILCSIYGVPVPIILRAQTAGYKMVGPCYIKDSMDTKMLHEVQDMFVSIGKGLQEFKIS